MRNIKKGEANPAQRRIYGTVALDDGTPSTDADTGAPAHSYVVSINGGALQDAGGNFVGDAAGQYYYEASASEVSGYDGFLAFGVFRTGYQPTWFEPATVGDPWTVGETATAKLRQPLFVFDDSSPPQLASATVTVPSQLQTALNSVSFTDAAGSLSFVGNGLHYYQGVTADAAFEGALAIRFAKAGYQTQFAFTLVTIPGGGSSAVIAGPTTPSASASGYSFVPLTPTTGATPLPSATLTGQLDQLIDPVTLDYVRTPTGDHVLTADSRTIVLLMHELEFGASPFTPNDGTVIKATIRAGDPGITPELLQAEAVRIGQILTRAGVLSNFQAAIVDSSGDPLVDEHGRQVVLETWTDLASGNPVNAFYTPR